MRTLILLSMAAFCLLGGCSRTEGERDSQTEIRLGTKGVTRAVNTLGDLSDVGDRIGIYGVRIAGTSAGASGKESWSNELVMDNVRTSDVDPSTGSIGWAGHYYYPLEEDRSVEFCAYHPYAAAGSDGDCFVEAPAPGKAPALHFTLSGQEDVMCAEPVIGSRSRVPGPLEFRHVLTQLRFRLVDPEGAFAGETLDEIALLDVNTTGVMDVETGALGAWGDPAELAVPGIETVPITGSEELPQEVGGEVMLQPGLSSFVIRVVTSRGSYDRVVIRPTSVMGETVETSFAAGRSYLITLTFRPLTGISLSATVVPWQMGGTGSGVVQ